MSLTLPQGGLDIAKQAKVTQILGGSEGRRSSGNRGPRLGSRESLESMSQYEAGDEVRVITFKRKLDLSEKETKN